ncbi:uncharacterized protein NEMAJ01_2134 [Nematocida major]|uniref:uncharacterized protein n=1 Tax=Nematocida major TaxID=1912982 RepID=UPI00200754DC|nr:uncharacterized protein NEMAJ01_2134 [Nematocida major]KAH9387238.1 hypothetical protein NEMAJ01_2134 [Nematocida major]
MHAKFYALAIAALAHCAHARVSFDEIIEVQNTKVGKSNAFINPRGPLCLLRGLVYSELACMHNKRFFAPEIETDYKVEPGQDVKKIWGHTYTRKAQNDKPYPSAEGPALGSKPASTDYAKEYHRTLIEMFPSVDGQTLSVAVAREDSFFQALQRMPSKHAHCVLAALLLLSEGIDVPIKATQKTITLETGSIKVGADSCKKAAQVINFFKDNKGKGKLPGTQSDFNTGDFLNTPQFLIQAYVFEYITSKSDALDFAACAHAILTSLPEDSCKDVYNACFVGSKAEAEEDELLRPLRMIQTKMEILQTFPFASPSMLPAYTSVRACKRGQTEFLEETFSNCVETGLFALFCCLAHDPDQKEYDADAMLGKKKGHKTTEALRKFFQLKGVSPKVCATKETMQEWNRVVSDLQSEHIAYVRPSRNEVRSGIFNVLYVVAEAAGRREKEEEPRIRELELMLEGCKIGKTSGDVFEKTKKYMAELFASLSVDKSLKVSFSDLMVDARSDGQKDLYGKITLKYTDKDSVVEQGICLAFKPGHLTVTLCPCVFLSFTDEEKEAFFAVDSYSEPADFAECLLAKYADAWRARGMDPRGKMLAERIREATGRLAADAAPEHPNELLVLGLALKQDQTFAITKDFIFHAAAKGTELTQEHPGVRLLSNLLGSLPLEDNATQRNSLGNIVCLDMLGRLFPKIGLSKGRLVIFYRNPYNVIDIWKYTGTNCAPAGNAIMKYLTEYKDKAGQPLFLCQPLLRSFDIDVLFSLLLVDNSTARIDKICELIVDVEEEHLEMARDAKEIFELLLFLASLKRKDTPSELVLALWRRVGLNSIDAYRRSYYIDSNEASAFLQDLEMRRSALSQVPGGEEVFNSVVGMLQSIVDQNE